MRSGVTSVARRERTRYARSCLEVCYAESFLHIEARRRAPERDGPASSSGVRRHEKEDRRLLVWVRRFMRSDAAPLYAMRVTHPHRALRYLSRDYMSPSFAPMEAPERRRRVRRVAV